MRTERFITPVVDCVLKNVSVTSKVQSGAKLLIGTHSGKFHADEALGCGMLLMTETFSGAQICRTRNQKLLKRCNLVLDVGAVYNSKRMRFDHHQSEFQGTFDSGVNVYQTRLSSAGMIYKHFGIEVLTRFVTAVRPSQLEDFQKNQLILYDALYRIYMENIDGVDNGVEPFTVVGSNKASLQTNYLMTKSTLSSRISRLNRRPNEGKEYSQDKAFVDAMRIALTEFLEVFDDLLCAWLPARMIVSEAFKNATHDGRIIVLGEHCPWQDHLFEIEKQHKVQGRTLYVRFKGIGSDWRVQAVSVEGGQFTSRKPLPFAGLRDNELSEASGIKGGIFVHASGFISGWSSSDAAMAFAEKALSDC